MLFGGNKAEGQNQGGTSSMFPGKPTEQTGGQTQPGQTQPGQKPLTEGEKALQDDRQSA